MVKQVCTPDCPDRHPAWKAERKKEKEYTKDQIFAGKVNKNDFDAEFWMGGRHR